MVGLYLLEDLELLCCDMVQDAMAAAALVRCDVGHAPCGKPRGTGVAQQAQGQTTPHDEIAVVLHMTCNQAEQETVTPHCGNVSCMGACARPYNAYSGPHPPTRCCCTSKLQPGNRLYLTHEAGAATAQQAHPPSSKASL
jgi:hypothetical protein